jgi:hypothetical protein
MSLVLSNQTAFPLNVSLCHDAQISQHKNELQPGQAWSVCPPVAASPTFFSFWKTHTIALNVYFDHGTNQLCESTQSLVKGKKNASRLLSWLVLVNFGILVVLTTGHFVARTGGILFWHGSSHLRQSKYLMILLLCVDVGFCAKAYRKECWGNSSPHSPRLPGGGASAPVLTMNIPSQFLQPNTQNATFSLPTSAARLERRLALVWWKSRVTLWDIDRDQAVTITPS